MNTHHICLTGESLTGDWELVRLIKTDHFVTLIEHLDSPRLANDALLRTLSLIVVDCTGSVADLKKVFASIRTIRKANPRAIVLLVDGGLKQVQLARAFRLGVRDYFRSPYESRLLAERISSLCARELRDPETDG
jgi:DNA-binding response OmpR family regulator